MATFAANKVHDFGVAPVARREVFDGLLRQVQVPDDYARRRSTGTSPGHGCLQDRGLELQGPLLARGHYGALSMAHASVVDDDLVTLPRAAGRRSTDDDAHLDAPALAELPAPRQDANLGLGDLHAV